MKRTQEYDLSDSGLLLAGHRVCAGVYREIGTNRLVRLDADGCLPASFDGRVACYRRVTDERCGAAGAKTQAGSRAEASRS